MSAGGPDREAVMAALASVPEPCSIAMRRPTDIVAMGLVESVTIEAMPRLRLPAKPATTRGGLR